MGFAAAEALNVENRSGLRGVTPIPTFPLKGEGAFVVSEVPKSPLPLPRGGLGWGWSPQKLLTSTTGVVCGCHPHPNLPPRGGRDIKLPRHGFLEALDGVYVLVGAL